MIEFENFLETYGRYKSITPVRDNNIKGKYQFYVKDVSIMHLLLKEGKVEISYKPNKIYRVVDLPIFLKELQQEIDLERLNRSTAYNLQRPRSLMQHAKRKMTCQLGYKNKAMQQNAHFVEGLWRE